MTGVTGTEPHGGGEAAAPGRPRVPAAMAWRIAAAKANAAAAADRFVRGAVPCGRSPAAAAQLPALPARIGQRAAVAASAWSLPAIPPAGQPLSPVHPAARAPPGDHGAVVQVSDPRPA